MKDLIRRLQPDRFGDIVALVGACSGRDPCSPDGGRDFIARKHDTTGATSIPASGLEAGAEAPTGDPLPGQVMQIAQIPPATRWEERIFCAAPMGKKKPEEMAKQRSVFVNGAVTRGVRESAGNDDFDLMEKFAGYWLQIKVALRRRMPCCPIRPRG